MFKGLPFLVLFLWCLAATAVPPSQSDSLGFLMVVRSISIHGNKITKPHIILRELEFEEGDTIKSSELAGLVKLSRQNLMNTSLFNFVNIVREGQDSSLADFHISVTERWYTWPFPLFELAETNFNTWWLNKDFSRTNYGFYIVRENFRGRKETVKLRLQLGFDEQLALQYKIPYINRKQTTGMEFTVGSIRNHEVNYTTLDNKRIFYKNTDEFVRHEFFSRIKVISRRRLYNTVSFILQYNRGAVSDTITDLTTDYFKSNTTRAEYLTLTGLFKRDKRDYASYPLTGYMFALEFSKDGLGVFNNQRLNLLESFVTFNNHFHVEDRLYFAAGLKAKINWLDSPPYYLQRGLGYGNFVRGYEFYVMDGQSYGLAKTIFKYQLIKPTTGTFDFIPTEKFSKFHYSVYFNLFADFGYVVDDLYAQNNFLSNSLLVGSGIGLDFLTYYDMVMRVEYSVNKLGESGIFIHFIKPI